MGKMPAIGYDVYVIDVNGLLIGGLAEVIDVVGGHIIVKEHGGANYRWENGLDGIQEILKNQFGDQRARHLSHHL